MVAASAINGSMMIQVIVRQTVLDRSACLHFQTLRTPPENDLGPTVAPPVNIALGGHPTPPPVVT